MHKHLRSSWRKVLRDLWLNKARTSLVILAIAVGIFGLGVVTNSYAILAREMDANYLRTKPAAATLHTTTLDPAFLQTLQDLPQIDEVEARRMVVGRIQVDENEWKNIWLFVISDFGDVRLDKFFAESGQYPAQTGEILLERAALKLFDPGLGQMVNLKIPGGLVTSIRYTGSVHAPGLAPAWMEGYRYGFISPQTLTQLGGDPALDELKVTFTDKTLTQAGSRAAAFELKNWLETQGYLVTRSEVPQPGKHPHASQMATLLFLLEAFGLIALLLSAVLVVNMISALLAQQIRQIGVMKALGARTRQVAAIYYVMVFLLGLGGLALGLPTAILAGRGYAAFAADMLNFQIYDNSIGWPYLVLQTLVGLLVPLLAASYPVLHGSRATARAAMSDYGISQPAGRILALKINSHTLSRPFMLSLRNTFRQRGRLLLTLVTLALGGAGFIVAMNVSASMNYTVDNKFDAQKYDIQLTFTRPYPEQEIEEPASQVPGVAGVESWGSAQAVRWLDDGVESNKFSLIAPPENTALMTALPLVEGRWLAAGENAGKTPAIVFNHALMALHPGLKVGENMILKIAGQESTWRLVGVVQEIMSPPIAYVTQESLNAALGLDGLASTLVVVAEDHQVSSVAQTTRGLESRLASAGLEVGSTLHLADYRQAIEDHLRLLASFLVIMSVLVLLVGGLSLASTMSINILERTREIGVLRAIGASSRSILKIIVTEGGLIGALSWVMALLVSWPASAFVSATFGTTFFDAPLRFAVSIPGMILWLVISTGFAALASLYPARSATRFTVRQILAYE